MARLDEVCLHESWECTKEYQLGFTWHKCNDCDFNWTPTSYFGMNGQVGRCSICDSFNNSSDSLSAFRWPMYETKDSGKREEYDSGMVRDTQDGKPRWDLLLPADVPYNSQFLTRVAGLLARGAEKYSDRNWEQASGTAELDRFKSSALRHMMQWQTDESDEDHAAAVVFNLLAYESIKWKMDND